MERKDLRQLLASAQQELNRLMTKEKALSRKEKTHRKIVLGGGEVAKYLGLDVDQDMLVGFLITCAGLTEEQRKRFISNGARARVNENMKKEKKNKISTVKSKREKQQAGTVDPELKNDDSIQGKKETENGLNLRYQSRFSSMLGKAIEKEK